MRIPRKTFIWYQSLLKVSFCVFSVNDKIKEAIDSLIKASGVQEAFWVWSRTLSWIQGSSEDRGDVVS